MAELVEQANHISSIASSAASSTAKPKVALVTGGNRGIGLATARRLHRAGRQVVVTYRSEPPAGFVCLNKNPEDPINSNHLSCVRCDVTDTDSVDAAVSRIEELIGYVEILVSNAGVTRDGLVLRMSDSDFAEVIDANLTGGFRVARRTLKGMMRSRWGRMVFISSVAGLGGQAGQANYAASKSGLIGMARSLAKEFASRNITVNVVAPGPIDTDMLGALDAGQLDAIMSQVPLGRMGTPDELAAAVEFLTSEDSSYVTGTVMAVDGGISMS